MIFTKCGAILFQVVFTMLRSFPVLMSYPGDVGYSRGACWFSWQLIGEDCVMCISQPAAIVVFG